MRKEKVMTQKEQKRNGQNEGERGREEFVAKWKGNSEKNRKGVLKWV